jgi:hypothetical protein
MNVAEDPIVGTVRTFQDSWRGRKALCVLVGDGSGPQGESVRIVGNPVRGGGFTVSYVKSYDPGRGHARAAYEYLVRTFGGGIRAKEVRSDEGIGFHRAMAERGIVTSMEIDVSDERASPSPPRSGC